MNDVILQVDHPEVADVHGYRRLSRDYPPVNSNSSFPELPPPAYSSSFDYSPNFNNELVRRDFYDIYLEAS